MLLDSATRETREMYRLSGQVAAPQGFVVSRDGRRIALVGLDEQSELWMMEQLLK